MDPNTSPTSISLSVEEHSPALTSLEESGSVGDENEQFLFNLEHLDDVLFPSPMLTQSLVAIPEPSPLFQKKKEEVKTEDKFEMGRPDNFDKFDTFFNDDKFVNSMMFRDPVTWSMGYFSTLSCGRGDLWRERSIWHRSEATDRGMMQDKRNEANKINQTGGHSCGVLFWGW